MIKALIFDFDGLILDTETPAFQAWEEVFATYGCVLDIEIWRDSVGSAPDAFDPAQHLADCVGEPLDRAIVKALQRRRELELIARQEVMPGVLACVAAARARGLGLAIASSSPRDWVVGHLERLGLLGHFPKILTADDVARVKPSPDLFLAALDALAVRPDQAIVLEDSPNGLLAARRAGIFAVAVPNKITRHYDMKNADLVLESLEDMRLDEILAEVRGKQSP